ncbi:hypothetical protein JHW43_003529 [Diplocarpon mali]|nr:hypothetical protein JHW43_003529 [Diplocarpon mali]
MLFIASEQSGMLFTIALLAGLPAATRALTFGAYDLGLLGVYPTVNYVSLGQDSPRVQISQWDPRCANDSGLILLSLRGRNVKNPGGVILEPNGNLVWSETKYGQALNLQVQRYKGKDYLTFWSGTSGGPWGNGSYIMLDSSYELAHTVTSVEIDAGGDLHEFAITEHGTALFTIYQDKQVNCSDVGLSRLCWINDCLFQEVDIETGQLLFQWRASDHVPLSHSYSGIGKKGLTKKTSWDYFHINSVDKDDFGNYLISARHTHALYYIDPSGATLWRLGGKHSDFTDLSAGHASDFKWQHHARWQSNNTISLFDNHGNNVFHDRSDFSRGMTVRLDFDNMSVTLLKTYVHPDRILAISQGSMQVLPDNGNVMVGWGNTPAYTEFTADGQILCSTHYGASIFYEILDLGWVKSYRTFKSKWVGEPRDPPSIKVFNGKIFTSWNGATEIAKWRLESAKFSEASDSDFLAVEEVPKEGFETVFISDDWERRFVRVAALGKAGKVLGYSAVVDTSLSEYGSSQNGLASRPPQSSRLRKPDPKGLKHPVGFKYSLLQTGPYTAAPAPFVAEVFETVQWDLERRASGVGEGCLAEGRAADRDNVNRVATGQVAKSPGLDSMAGSVFISVGGGHVEDTGAESTGSVEVRPGDIDGAAAEHDVDPGGTEVFAGALSIDFAVALGLDVTEKIEPPLVSTSLSSAHTLRTSPSSVPGSSIQNP